MTGAAPSAPLIASGLGKSFRLDRERIVTALSDVSFRAKAGSVTAIVGPDGAGKSTLMRLVAGLVAPDSGTLSVLGIDVKASPQQVQDRIGYMPQRFGLYEDLSVQENLDLYADLHGVDMETRRERYPRLMEMTALGPFRARLAGNLSGGMKQKLGLACTLVGSPDLLLLDEPTVGVDPLSRRELWEIVFRLVKDDGLTVLLSTSYLDEAERCDHAVLLYEGKLLAEGHPSDISAKAAGRSFLVDPPAGSNVRGFQSRLLADAGIVDAVPQAGRVRLVKRDNAAEEANGPLSEVKPEPVASRFEDGFMTLLYGQTPRPHSGTDLLVRTSHQDESGLVVDVRDLVRTFGAFTAVNNVSFEVRRGEIFGLLGPNGAGKTTTFRMLCGLLPASGGTLCIAGTDVRKARASARKRIGYVAQKFSLYGQLTTRENLEFFASAYGLHNHRQKDRVNWAIDAFELGVYANLASERLPGGYKQRLAMAAALLHEPDILFLDEATSGADPMARREFWGRINALAEGGVTVIITTHAMEEAEYCDRVMILDAGRKLAEGTPAEIRRLARVPEGHQATMDDAFISIIMDARDKATERGAA